MKITESMIPAELLEEARRYWHQTRSPLIVYSNSIYDREVKVYANGPGYKFSVGDPYDPEVPTWREFLEERCMSSTITASPLGWDSGGRRVSRFTPDH